MIDAEDIPASWTLRRLNDVCETRTGGTPNRGNADFFRGSIPWIKSGALKDSLIVSAEELITDEAVDSSNAKVFPKGTLLMAMYGANVGKLGRLGIDAATNQAICAFFPRSDILSGFLWQYLRLIREELILSSFGAAQPNISQAFIRRLELPVPPLTEQERIVSRIESLTTRAQELAEHTQAIASDMQRAVASFYERLAAEAPQKPLEAVARPVRRPITTTPEGSYPELGLRSFGKGTFHKPALSGTEVGSKRIFRIHAGDLVFSNVFAWEGAIAVAQPEDDGRAGSHRYITYLADPEQSTAEFLCWHFLTPRGLEDIRAASPGSAGRNRTLGLERLKQIQVPVPPIEEQRRFTELVKRQREITIHAASITEDLRKFEAALLAKAFRGEL